MADYALWLTTRGGVSHVAKCGAHLEIGKLSQVLRREYPVHASGGILVTGASSGIGRHAAISLAKQGLVMRIPLA